MQLIKCILITSALIVQAPAIAEKRLDMRGTSIIGNKELPNMLYIIPWKSVSPVELEPPAIDSVLDQPLQALDRQSLKRRIRYHDRLRSEAQAND